MAFPAVPRLPSAFVLRRPELESEPERSLAMDSALRDPHNGSTQTPSPAHGTTRPPSTPQGIALAYGSLLLMALLPIFFGALRSVRCARGKVGSGGAGALHPQPGHGPHEPVPADPIAAPRDTHPPWHRSPFPPPASTSVGGLWCPRIWPLPKAGISIVLR